jgi:hypothetical protein
MSEILIEQVVPSQGGIITERVNNGDVWIQGIYMQAETKNRNGRNYPLAEMVAAVNQANVAIKENGGIFGELDHPQTITINMDRISHVITELYMNGNNAIGKAKLLDTPMGLIAKELAKSGVRYGVSSRGAGTVNEAGIVSGFGLVTVDLVVTPSAQGAMPNVVYESLDLANNGKEIIKLAECVKHDKEAQKYFQKEILKFVKQYLYK